MNTTQTHSPLDGKRIAITRAREQAEALATKLRAVGAIPIFWPMITFAPPLDAQPLAEALQNIARFDWVIFSSVNGVRAVIDRLSDVQSPLLRIAAVGPQTAQALSAAGLRVDAIPDEYLASEIVGVLGKVQDKRILLFHPDIAPSDLAESLRACGAQVQAVTAYRTLSAPSDGPLSLDAVDAITLASGSAAQQLATRLNGQPIPAHVCVACIGPSTAQAAREAGLPVGIVAQPHTLDGLVAALAAYYTREVNT